MTPATQPTIVSRFWNPPEERQLTDVYECAEKVMSGIYQIRKVGLVLQSTPEVGQLLAMVQVGREELFVQCEGLISLLENLSDQAQAYIHLAHFLSQTPKRDYANYLDKTIIDARRAAIDIRKIRAAQELGHRAFQEMSKLISSITSPSARANRGSGSTRRPSVRRSAERNALQALPKLVDETNTSFIRMTTSLKALETYYSQYPTHLRSFKDTPQHPSPPSTSLVRQHMPQKNEELARTDEVWARYQQAISEAISRLMRAADAMGKAPAPRATTFNDLPIPHTSERRYQARRSATVPPGRIADKENRAPFERERSKNGWLSLFCLG